MRGLSGVLRVAPERVVVAVGQRHVPERVLVRGEVVRRVRVRSGDADPLGNQFEIGWGERWDRVQVVGVVPDGRYASVSDAGRSFAFVPAAQWPRLDFSMIIHTDVRHADIGTEALRRLLEREMATLLPGVPPPPVHAFADAASVSILPQKILASAASALSGPPPKSSDGWSPMQMKKLDVAESGPPRAIDSVPSR